MKTFSTKLLALSALLLCSRVQCERNGSPQRRRAAVGDRATDAPTIIEVGKGMKSEVGKGMKSVKSLSEKSLGKGKGLKSDKSLKSLKSYGKGKGAKSEKSLKAFGKGLKSEKFGKSFDFAPGKGAKKAKDFKFGKSSKSYKSSKKGPHPADSISSKSNVFAITYSPSEEIPSARDLEQLTRMTQNYLEDFMMEFFDKTSLTDLDEFVTIMVGDVYVEGEPVIAEFQSNGLFNPDSIFIPVARELDNLIADAISQNEYLDMLYDLPKSNPFRGTDTIGFTQVDTTAEGETTSGEGGESSFVQAGVAAAAAGVVVLAAGLAMLKSRRPSLGDEDDDDMQAFKASSEDETCTVEDTSHHFPHWRTSRLEGAEFQDEPLDN